MSNTNAYKGTADAEDGLSDVNAISFVVETMINGISTAKLVQVKAVTNAGGVAPVGFVDVQPMVHQLDGYGQATPHGTVYHLCYFRLQGGANAVIMDPQVGDIGVAVICDRDISSAKVNKAPSNPGSRRKYDVADGIYVGGVLNGVPTQFIQFSAAGIQLTSPVAVNINAPAINLNP